MLNWPGIPGIEFSPAKGRALIAHFGVGSHNNIPRISVNRNLMSRAQGFAFIPKIMLDESDLK